MQAGDLQTHALADLHHKYVTAGILYFSLTQHVQHLVCRILATMYNIRNVHVPRVGDWGGGRELEKKPTALVFPVHLLRPQYLIMCSNLATWISIVPIKPIHQISTSTITELCVWQASTAIQ